MLKDFENWLEFCWIKEKCGFWRMGSGSGLPVVAEQPPSPVGGSSWLQLVLPSDNQEDDDLLGGGLLTFHRTNKAPGTCKGVGGYP